MPWLTPDSIPEDDDCRPLLIPADSAWLALVSGALTELTLPYNWQKFGTLTVQETVDKMQSIIDNYYNSPCAMCVTPGGYRVTRISSNGHLEELNSDGSWQDGTGDYSIPAPTARTDGTTQQQNCLAAKNATNVLFQLYESLSDSFSSELTAAEALTAFATSAIAAIGFEFAPITFSIAAFMFVVFEALFAALGYLTADLWTDDFTKAFECLLLNCVMNDAGVVTFDWDCLQAALVAQTDTFGLSEIQLRLYLQISYILYFIGGVDGLNLAARTTDITNEDCSFCPVEWCVSSDYTTIEDLANMTNEGGVWGVGDGYVGSAYIGFNSFSQQYPATALTPVEVTHLEMTYSASGFGVGGNGNIQLYLGGVSVVTVSTTTAGSHLTVVWDGSQSIDRFYLTLGSHDSGGVVKLESWLLRGMGTIPDIGQIVC